MDRRHFLLCCPALLLGARTMTGCGDGLAYDRAELLKAFEDQVPWYAAALGEDAAAMAPVADAARAKFLEYAHHVPFIGPIDWPLPGTLVASAIALAFHRTLTDAGSSRLEAGRVVDDAFEHGLLGTCSLQDLVDRGRQQFTAEFYGKQRYFARESQKATYLGDWIYEFVEGATPDEWGLDFTQCGIVELYRKLGAADLVPFLCVQDFIASQYEKTGLVRIGTLATGAAKCDFRYRKDRPVTIPPVT